MKLVLQSKNIEITDAIRDYVNQKIEKAVSHFENITTGIDVNLSVAKNPRIAASQWNGPGIPWKPMRENR